MLELWNQFCLVPLDWIMGWALSLPADLLLVLVALGSAGILTGVRRMTTDQDLLRRVGDDKKRLKILMREARQKKDRVALRRMQSTHGRVAMKALAQEGRPLLISLLPIAMLATWCFARMDFHPVQAGETVDVLMFTPVSAIGEPIHVVPQAGLEAADRHWLRIVEPDQAPDGSVSNGRAQWHLRGDAGRYRLQFRVKNDTFEQDFLVDGRIYPPPVADHGGQFISQLDLRRVRPFGVVPGFDAWALPPWMLGYVLIVLPGVFLTRRLSATY